MSSSDYNRFLSTIADFPEKFRETLIKEYHEVVAEMPARRAQIEKDYPYTPGNVLQRSPANSYKNGNFLVYWHENKVELYHPEDVLALLKLLERERELKNQ